VSNNSLTESTKSSSNKPIKSKTSESHSSTTKNSLSTSIKTRPIPPIYNLNSPSLQLKMSKNNDHPPNYLSPKATPPSPSTIQADKKSPWSAKNFHPQNHQLTITFYAQKSNKRSASKKIMELSSPSTSLSPLMKNFREKSSLWKNTFRHFARWNTKETKRLF
jgi:hypothetical protein